jgi:hypothetical protein
MPALFFCALEVEGRPAEVEGRPIIRPRKPRRPWKSRAAPFQGRPIIRKPRPIIPPGWKSRASRAGPGSRGPPDHPQAAPALEVEGRAARSSRPQAAPFQGRPIIRPAEVEGKPRRPCPGSRGPRPDHPPDHPQAAPALEVEGRPAEVEGRKTFRPSFDKRQIAV